MEDHNLYRLTDLVNSDFEMSSKDKDYQLDIEQVIKVCKILLHKINHNWMKTIHENENNKDQMREEMNMSERNVKSSMEEVNQFLQTVHQDFESFLKRHSRERNDYNVKIQKLSDVANKTLDNLE